MANGGVPPVGASYDAATTNSEVSMAFVGLKSQASLALVDFFRACTVVKLDALCYPFGYLRYHCAETSRSWILAGLYGGYHAQKRGCGRT